MSPDLIVSLAMKVVSTVSGVENSPVMVKTAENLMVPKIQADLKKNNQ